MAFKQLRCQNCNKRLLDIDSRNYALTVYCPRCKMLRAFSNIAIEQQQKNTESVTR